MCGLRCSTFNGHHIVHSADLYYIFLYFSLSPSLYSCCTHLLYVPQAATRPAVWLFLILSSVVFMQYPFTCLAQYFMSFMTLRRKFVGMTSVNSIRFYWTPGTPRVSFVLY